MAIFQLYPSKFAIMHVSNNSYIVRVVEDTVNTATVETVHTKDVDRAHLGCPTNRDVFIRDGNDGWLPVL